MSVAGLTNSAQAQPSQSQHSKHVLSIQLQTVNRAEWSFYFTFESKVCGMETEMGRVIEGRSFTPHGIEDILRRETRIVVDDDSDVDSYQGGERDSFGPLNLSKCYQTETDRYKMVQEETDCRNTKTAKMVRKKKMRTTFTGRQIFELERMFETKKYLNASERSNISR